MAPHISIVCPMHNEAACVEEFVRRTDAALRAMGHTNEIVVVSDGSTDQTEAILHRLVQSVPTLRCIFLARNVGQCGALLAGLQESTGEVVVIMDGDLQHPPEEIHLLISAMGDGFDLVSGSRRDRVESLLFRRFPSFIANALLRWVSRCEVRDMGGFKAVRGDLARSLRLRSGQHRLLPALVSLRGGRVGEVFVTAPPRFAGTSHYGITRTLDVLFDIVLLWFEGSFRSRPIYLFGRVALALLAVDCVLMPFLLWDKFFVGIDLGTRPPFLLAIMFFLSALLLLASGLILELLSDALNAVTDRKPFIIRSKVGFDRS